MRKFGEISFPVTRQNKKLPDEREFFCQFNASMAAVIHAICSHGWGICTDVEPLTDMEKSLFTVDELTGIIEACARMRPHGITDLEVKSFMKKFKDKRFAAKCDRALILKGCEMLGMELGEVAVATVVGCAVDIEAEVLVAFSEIKGIGVNRLAL